MIKRILNAIFNGLAAIGLGMAGAIGLFIGIAALCDDSFPLWFRIVLGAAFLLTIGVQFIGEGRDSSGSQTE